jgi:hypothetical protein
MLESLDQVSPPGSLQPGLGLREYKQHELLLITVERLVEEL